MARFLKNSLVPLGSRVVRPSRVLLLLRSDPSTAAQAQDYQQQLEEVLAAQQKLM